MYRLVPITLEEYRILFDAGVWVYAYSASAEGWALECESDTHDPELRDMEWSHCYTRVEECD